MRASGQRSARASLALLLAAVGVTATALLVATRMLDLGTSATIEDAGRALPLIGSVLAFLLSGAIVASRHPDNSIGWVLMIPGLAVPIAELANDWLAGLDPPPEHATPLLWVLVWFCSWSWILLIFPIFHLLLTFPSGRLLSPRWRLAVVLEVLMVGTFVVLAGLMAELSVLVADEDLWSIANPIGFLTWDAFDRYVSGPWELGLLTLTGLSVSAVVLRFRNGTPEARHQLKWPLAAVAFFGVVYGLAGAAMNGIVGQLWNLLFGLAIAFIPISVAIAIMRYRLYEIDRIISRTISWAIVTGLLVAVFASGVVGLQAVLGGYIQGQTLPVAASTLVAFALFQPVRRRVQARIDRRFNRARYDAQVTVDGFAGRLRDEVDLPVLLDELTRTTADTVQPRATSVWLRARGVT